MLPPGEARDHPPGLGGVRGLPEDLAVQDDRRVGAQHGALLRHARAGRHVASLPHGMGRDEISRRRGRGVVLLVPGGDRPERDAEGAEKRTPLRRARRQQDQPTSSASVK
jgi:hypothetical protein